MGHGIFSRVKTLQTGGIEKVGVIARCSNWLGGGKKADRDAKKTLGETLQKKKTGFA